MRPAPLSHAIRSTSIELLEPRIAPAAVVMITDTDGDLVAVKTSKGTKEQLTAAIKTSGLNQTGIIQEIDFSQVPLVNGVNPFAGTNLTVSVVKQGASGDGLVNVGYIDASSTNGSGTDGAGLSLGKVKIGGDLGQIDVGTGGDSLALKNLTVKSIGSWGLGTQAVANRSSTSNFSGKVGTIKVTGGVSFSVLNFDSSVTKIDIAREMIDSSVTGTGDLLNVRIGKAVINSGFAADSLKTMQVIGSFNANMTLTGDLGSLKVGGNFIAGRITAMDMTNIAIKGSMVGFDGVAESASILATGNIGKVAVGRDLLAGAASSSGRISAAGNISLVTIGGSIVGPQSSSDNLPLNFAALNAATIFAGGNLNTIRVGGDLLGPILPGIQDDSPQFAASCSTITATGDIGTVVIAGSVRGIIGEVSGTSRNVRIVATHLGSVTIGGDFTGILFSDPPEIAALGSADQPAIGKLTIGGSLRLATVVAGSIDNSIGSPRNADGKIGPVSIAGDLDRATITTLDIGSGVTDNINITSSIERISIGGQITGNSVIRAEHLVSVKLGGFTFKLQAGARNDTTPIVFAPGTASIAEFV